MSDNIREAGCEANFIQWVDREICKMDIITANKEFVLSTRDAALIRSKTLSEVKNRFLPIKTDDWIKTTDWLPELTDPFMMYNDDGIREVAWENDHVFVLAFHPEFGIIKAKRDKRGWTETTSISIKGIPTPTHWKPLPQIPN